MAKAWERRFGAHVELDVEKQSAQLTLPSVRVDVAGIAKAAEEAGYTVTQMKIEISGLVEEAECAACAQRRRFLRAASTHLELRGPEVPEAGRPARIRGRVQEWTTSHPFVRVMSK